jgi:CelD/BcsL family acetyltransferase involved in cellulose biosynthesis
MAAELGIDQIQIKHPVADSQLVFRELGFQEQKHWVATRVGLTAGAEKIWHDILRSPTRRAVKKANNSGLVARWTEREEDLDKFYGMFLKARRQLGIPAYSRRFFRAIYRRMVPQGLARMLLVEEGKRVVAALIVFPWKKEVISAYMGYDAQLSELRPNDLLFWEAIRWSAEAGFQSFYFGADSPLQEGLLGYKRKWGGEQSVIPYYSFSLRGKETSSLDSSHPKFAFYRRVFSLMPNHLFRWTGAAVTRRLS